MLNDLLLSKIKLKAISIDGIPIKDEYVEDFVIDIEIESNLKRPYLMIVMTFEEDLITLSSGKNLQDLQDTKIGIELHDFNDTFIRKTCYVEKIAKQTPSTSKNVWVATLTDEFGMILKSSRNSRKIDKSYEGKPIEILEKVIKDLYDFDYLTKESQKSILNKFTFKSNKNFLGNDITVIHKFVVNKTPYDNLESFCRIYNITMFQDNFKIEFVQNLSFKPEDCVKYEDDTSLYEENCDSKSYAYKVCDKITQPTSVNNVAKVNYVIENCGVGKKVTYKTINFKDVTSQLIVNESCKNLDLYKLEDVKLSNYTSSLSSLAYDEFFKYITNNIISVYVRSSFDKTNVGQVISINLASDARFAQDRIKGDTGYSGNWIILSSTVKIIADIYFYRLVLCRFENPTEHEKLITTDNSSQSKEINVENAKKKREALLAKKR